MSNPDDTVWMSEAAAAKVQAELDELSGPIRAEIVERIAAARDEGDLKENGGYHAAKDEQGKLEARIRQLDEILRTADTTAPVDDQTISAGKLVETEPRFSDDDNRVPFLLAVRVMDDAYPADLDVFSPQSPLGSALLGAKEGSTIDYEAPNGRTINVTIVKVTPFRD